MLKPIDLTVVTYLVAVDLGPSWTQTEVAHGLAISQSMVHRSLQQLRSSSLLSDTVPRRRPLRELLLHGVRYVYPPVLGPPARGVPTAHSAPAWTDIIHGDDALVWPFDAGTTYGPSLAPLHPCVPATAVNNPRFYEFMTLIDILRVGRVREVQLATERLDQLLESTP